jgi:hypothetical protein
MPINSKRVGDNVVHKLKRIGIDDKVGNAESHTALMIRMIVDEILSEIINNGEIIIAQLPVVLPPPFPPGVGNGKAKII